MIALVGSAVGVAAAVGYSRLLLSLLLELWPDETVRTFLAPHTSAASFLIGFVGTVAMAGLAIAFALRGLVKVSPPALLRGADRTARTAGVHLPTVLARLARRSGLSGARLPDGRRAQANPDYRAMSFFGGGGLLLTAGVLGVRAWLRADLGTCRPTAGSGRLIALGRRNAARYPRPQPAHRRTPRRRRVPARRGRELPPHSGPGLPSRTGGSGGFNLIAEADVPVFQPFDTRPDATTCSIRSRPSTRRRGSAGPP